MSCEGFTPFASPFRQADLALLGVAGIQCPLKEQLLVGREWRWLCELLIPGQVDAVQLLQLFPIPDVKWKHRDDDLPQNLRHIRSFHCGHRHCPESSFYQC
jgi:hypothetical protein